MRGCPCRGSGLHPPPPLPSSPFTTSTLASPLFPRHTGPTSASQILNLLYPRPGVFFSWDVPKVCSPPPWGLYLNLTFLPWTNVCNLLVKKFSLYRPSWLYIFSSTVIPPDILYFLLVCLCWSPVSSRRTLTGLCYLLFAIISPRPRTASGHSRHFINICQKKR